MVGSFHIGLFVCNLVKIGNIRTYLLYRKLVGKRQIDSIELLIMFTVFTNDSFNFKKVLFITHTQNYLQVRNQRYNESG